MSAYGAFQHTRQNDILGTTLWPVKAQPNSEPSEYVTVHHLTLEIAQTFAGLLDYLHVTFAQEVDDGMTYPQEGEISRPAFEAYFFAADVLLAIVGASKRSTNAAGVEEAVTFEQARADRIWSECVAGFYYVKPNYPGRSSHICNAGFIVPPIHRGAGYGSVLAQSYLHYAPRLGYKASVFNLVYINNTASVRLWERLGFTKAGLIPKAGRLKRKDGQGEEYVDAWVFYKSFEE
ncbi:acyl-CoA N-acyltransferase [Pluteus cervinus]|uniref:Acyl-CoA N-acyltransferase n=1 Tax=Pluteus cervinus TaxID=181527 RepID=A0ACD3BAH2_9AGAR|nr:acyl-CoA N-acyltransferase [Pluteus cervinus]